MAILEADGIYYRRRAAEEATIALTAIDPGVRLIHEQLAAQYAERAVNPVAPLLTAPHLRT